MGDQMNFPNTFDEFAEEYKIVDKEQVYTNGAEFIPIFRVKQWLENTVDLINRQKADNKKLLKECYELHKDANRLKEENASQKAEIESYKHLDVILNTAIDKLAKDLKSEAYREFAEEAKKRTGMDYLIDELLKELVGEDLRTVGDAGPYNGNGGEDK